MGGAGGNRLVLVVAAGVFVVVAGAGLALLAGGGAGPSAGTCAQVNPGQSVADTYLGNLEAGSLEEVDCSQPHNIEVLHTISTSEARQNDISSISAAERFCQDRYFESYVGSPWEDSELDLEAAWLGLDDESYEDEEPVVCFIIDGGPFNPTTGSVRGSNR